jgi:hypothetical protein
MASPQLKRLRGDNVVFRKIDPNGEDDQDGQNAFFANLDIYCMGKIRRDYMRDLYNERDTLVFREALVYEHEKGYYSVGMIITKEQGSSLSIELLCVKDHRGAQVLFAFKQLVLNDFRHITTIDIDAVPNRVTWWFQQGFRVPGVSEEDFVGIVEQLKQMIPPLPGLVWHKWVKRWTNALHESLKLDVPDESKLQSFQDTVIKYSRKPLKIGYASVTLTVPAKKERRLRKTLFDMLKDAFNVAGFRMTYQVAREVALHCQICASTENLCLENNERVFCSVACQAQYDGGWELFTAASR